MSADLFKSLSEGDFSKIETCQLFGRGHYSELFDIAHDALIYGPLVLLSKILARPLLDWYAVKPARCSAQSPRENGVER